MEEIRELLIARGLSTVPKRHWLCVGNKPGKRVYIKNPSKKGAVREFHISEFELVHQSVEPISAEKARRKKLGNVRGIVRCPKEPDAYEVRGILDALGKAFDQVAADLEKATQNLQESAQREDLADADLHEDEIRITQSSSLDEERLSFWLNHRIGYGNLDVAVAWFLGMEEACDERELPFRLQGADVEDLADALRRLRLNKLMGPKAKLQSTWAPLIHTWLAATCKGEIVAQKDVRTCQGTQWGRTDGQTLLAELLPLPAPKTSSWPYQSMPNHPELETRKRYQSAWLEHRIGALAALWSNSSARIAVAYGKTYWPHYQRVFGLDRPIDSITTMPGYVWAEIHEVNGRGIAVVAHPQARDGSRNEHWQDLGRRLSIYLT